MNGLQNIVSFLTKIDLITLRFLEDQIHKKVSSTSDASFYFMLIQGIINYDLKNLKAVFELPWGPFRSTILGSALPSKTAC